MKTISLKSLLLATLLVVVPLQAQASWSWSAFNTHKITEIASQLKNKAIGLAVSAWEKIKEHKVLTVAVSTFFVGSIGAYLFKKKRSLFSDNSDTHMQENSLLEQKKNELRKEVETLRLKVRRLKSQTDSIDFQQYKNVGMMKSLYEVEILNRQLKQIAEKSIDEIEKLKEEKEALKKLDLVLRYMIDMEQSCNTAISEMRDARKSEAQEKAIDLPLNQESQEQLKEQEEKAHRQTMVNDLTQSKHLDLQKMFGDEDGCVEKSLLEQAVEMIIEQPHKADNAQEVKSWEEQWADIARSYNCLNINEAPDLSNPAWRSWRGYMIFELFKGKRNQKELKDLFVLEGAHGDKMRIPEVKAELAANYKIHLMPKNNQDIGIILSALLKAAQENEAFNVLIHAFKLKLDPENLMRGAETMPKIVIYPASGKENAQALLNKIYEITKNMEGMDVVPRYNEKITNLVYVAQGDADYKGYHQIYYEPGYVYYSPLFECNNDSDQPKDYHLQSPVLQEQIDIMFDDKHTLYTIVTKPADKVVVQTEDLATSWTSFDIPKVIQEESVTGLHNTTVTKYTVLPMTASSNAKHKIIFVAAHGTFATPNAFGIDPERLTSQALHQNAQDLAKAYSCAVEMLVFKWSGKLNRDERTMAGHALAAKLQEEVEIAKQRGVEVEVITFAHSHGCNVILNAAQVLADNGITIDKAIQVASPAQDIFPEKATKVTNQELFNAVAKRQDLETDNKCCYNIKAIYHLYSVGDMTQLIGSEENQKWAQRKVPYYQSKNRRVYNIHLQYDGKLLNHIDIKCYAAKNMLWLILMADSWYPCYNDLDVDLGYTVVDNLMAIHRENPYISEFLNDSWIERKYKGNATAEIQKYSDMQKEKYKQKHGIEFASYADKNSVSAIAKTIMSFGGEIVLKIKGHKF